MGDEDKPKKKGKDAVKNGKVLNGAENGKKPNGESNGSVATGPTRRCSLLGVRIRISLTTAPTQAVSPYTM